MSLSDLLIIVAISLGSAAVVGGAGLVALRLARTRSVLLQLCFVVVTAIGSAIVGMVAVAQAMYLSAHDLVVTMYVAITSGLVALALAVFLGRVFIRNSEQLKVIARSLGNGQAITGQNGPAVDHGSTELTALARELAETDRRLSEAHAEMTKLESSRRELIAWISHDLRTPLAGMRAMAEALEDGMVDDPRRYYSQMRAAVDRLSGMVDDLFELSKINTGSLSLALEPTSLYDVASDVAAELTPLAQSREITLIESHTDKPVVLADARELARVITNLVINALQHSPPASQVTICTRCERSWALLRVVDTGAGIPEADRERVFEAGWRGTNSRTPDQTGSGSAGAGLGLAIARGIMGAHHGEISVSSTSKGTQFEIRLPLLVLS